MTDNTILSYYIHIVYRGFADTIMTFMSVASVCITQDILIQIQKAATHSCMLTHNDGLQNKTAKGAKHTKQQRVRVVLLYSYCVQVGLQTL